MTYRVIVNTEFTTVTAATAYDDPISGDTFIRIFHETLYYVQTHHHDQPTPLESFGGYRGASHGSRRKSYHEPMEALSCNRSDYLDANSDKALLDSIDPSLAHFADHLKSSHCSMAQVETVYDQLDTAS
jgi:hypothetical protein